MDDGPAVAAQIGRPLRSAADVVLRCPLGLPVVTRVPPILDDGSPFPTLFWLSCPLAVRRIGRIEAAGGVRALERHATGTPEFDARLTEAHRRYAAERDAAVPPGAAHPPSGGVGGTDAGGGVKCLHAHYADHAAGNDNPVGRAVAPFVEPLDCPVACVVETDGLAGRNPAWREPR
ncbi:MAG: DUF501 domain-containing protein [Actinobacteria bacterium]|nr:DUF501 domain-containing protein [Actinomycetota bacterium]